MTPVSIPAYPPQPNLAAYDISKLETVQEYTADSYLQAWGIAPHWDPSLPIKTWFDSSVANLPPYQFVSYEAIQQINGQWQIAPLNLPASAAATVNIPPSWPMQPSPNPIMPVPLRPLLPNERLSPVFGVFDHVVTRTDMQQTGMNQPAPASTAGDGFTPADRSLLQAIASKLGVALLVLLLVGWTAHAQTSAKSASDTLPTEGVALGAAYAPGGTPNIAGWISQWNRIASGFYNYNSFDVTSLKQSPFTAQNSARAGLAYFIKAIGPVQVFGLGDAGVATAATNKGTSIGSAFSGGGGAVLPLGKTKDYGLIFCVRVLKTALAGSQNVYELGFAWGK